MHIIPFLNHFQHVIMFHRFQNIAFLLIINAATATTSIATKPINPEDSSGFNIKPLISSKKNMIVTANPYASDAGALMMKSGGNAVDALIAAQLVLGLVEPQSSGIGGGAFAVMYHHQSKNISAWDGRETAPQKATDVLFKKPDGTIANFYDMVPSGKSVGVPGVLKMLWQLHQKQGKLPWRKLFQPAILLAHQGFSISPRLAKMIASEIHFSDEAKNYFYDAQGMPKKAGTILKNYQYAYTLQVLSQQGIEPFYNTTDSKGIAFDIMDTVKRYGGTMEGEDLANYSVKNRDVKCQNYRQYNVCGSDFPSGATTVLETLALLSHFDLSIFNPSVAPSINQNTPPTVNSLALKIPTAAIHLFAEATKIAYADRNQYATDPDFAAIPNQLLNPEYIKIRQKEIKNDSQGIAKAGIFDLNIGADKTLEIPGTSHISVVDDFGNAISMTTSIEDKFGSRLFVRGFLLNNTLSDFSFTSKNEQGQSINNRIHGGKRPRSAMSPVLIFKRKNDKEIGELHGVVGSPGGSLIINYVTQSLIALLDWNLTPQEVAHLPHFGSRNNTNKATELEDWSKFNSNDDATQELIQSQQEHLNVVKEELEDKNHVVQFIEQPSGLGIIIRKGKMWQGAADPRREGSVVGN